MAETNKLIKNDERIFTEKQIENFVGFFNTLQQIHNRLMREGYVFKGGKLIPPGNKKQA